MIRRIATCESGLNPAAYNPSGSSGLMQFMPSTYASTPYAMHSLWRARWSALAGAWAIRHWGTSPWTASQPCWG